LGLNGTRQETRHVETRGCQPIDRGKTSGNFWYYVSSATNLQIASDFQPAIFTLSGFPSSI
jgi:hypothetical protein